MKLNQKTCSTCSGDIALLTQTEVDNLKTYLNSNWLIVDNHHIKRSFKFDDFISALEFTNKVGAIAEAEAHHPDIYLAWGQVEISIFTHHVNGLTENDFILAAKIDELV